MFSGLVSDCIITITTKISHLAQYNCDVCHQADEHIIIRHPLPQRVDHVATVRRQEPATINITAFDIADPLTGYMGASYYEDDPNTAGGEVIYLGQ